MRSPSFWILIAASTLLLKISFQLEGIYLEQKYTHTVSWFLPRQVDRNSREKICYFYKKLKRISWHVTDTLNLILETVVTGKSKIHVDLLDRTKFSNTSGKIMKPSPSRCCWLRVTVMWGTISSCSIHIAQIFSIIMREILRILPNFYRCYPFWCILRISNFSLRIDKEIGPSLQKR